MTAASQTAGLNNPTTGAERLLAVTRWVIILLFVHWLIGRGRKLVATLHQRIPESDLARINRGLTRATALHAELLALRPTEGALDDIARRRAIAAVVIEICTDLGIFRGKRTTGIAKDSPRRVLHHWPLIATALRGQACPAIPLLATPCGSRGPPEVHLAHDVGRETVLQSAGGRPASGAIGVATKET